MDDIAILKRIKKRNNATSRYGVSIYTCPVCVKEFSTAGTVAWGYKTLGGKLTLCGYNCMRKAQRLLGII